MTTAFRSPASRHFTITRVPGRRFVAEDSPSSRSFTFVGRPTLWMRYAPPPLDGAGAAGATVFPDIAGGEQRCRA